MSVATLPTPVSAGRRSPAPAGFRIDAHGLRVTRRRAQILNEVSSTLEPGQLVAIIGGSGAGKTTLLDAAGRRAGAERREWSASTGSTSTSTATACAR